MVARRYFSQRQGRHRHLGLDDLKGLVYSLFDRFVERQFFDKTLGYHCGDQGFVAGTLGGDPAAEIHYRLRRPNLWPLIDHVASYSEDDLFDIIEFLYDSVSQPIDGSYHSYDSATHFTTFDDRKGQDEFRNELNELLVDYESGFELSANGEILSLAPLGIQPLFTQPWPTSLPPEVRAKIDEALLAFRRHGATDGERMQVVVTLFGVLELLRPQLKGIWMSQDEADLFLLANNFGIRHFNSRQKLNYDKDLWVPWMFYVLVATLHVVTRALARKGRAAWGVALPDLPSGR